MKKYKLMKISERVQGLAWVGLGLMVCVESIRLHLGSVREPGPGFMPFLTGCLLALSGFVLTMVNILQRVYRKEPPQDQDKDAFEGTDSRGFLITSLVVSSLLAYSLVLNYGGFLLTSFLFLFFLLKLLYPRRWFMPLLVSSITVFVCYLVFLHWLQCQFPRGILGY
jgi:putative tricarboxylic transport membrane protein